MLVYIAGPLFNLQDRSYLEQIANYLEKAGFDTFLPHRDAGLLQISSESSRLDLFKSDLEALEKADLVVALLTGADHDSGTSAELGYAYAKRKPCFGISDDFRWLNNIIWGICGEGQYIVRTIDELLPLILSLNPLERED